MDDGERERECVCVSLSKMHKYKDKHYHTTYKQCIYSIYTVYYYCHSNNNNYYYYCHVQKKLCIQTQTIFDEMQSNAAATRTTTIVK